MFKGLFDFRNQSIIVRYRIIIPILLLIIIGLVMLYSQSGYKEEYYNNFISQIQWFVLGAFLFMLVQYVRLQYIYDHSYVFYILIVIILIGTLIFGESGKYGGVSWVSIGGIRGQPSEFCKILYVFFFARFLSDINTKSKTRFYLPVMILSLIVPFLLVLRQGDLGTALIYLSIVLPLMYSSGIKAITLFFIVSPFVSMIASFQLIFFTIWMIVFCILMLVYRPDLKFSIYNFIINISSGILASILWTDILSSYHRERIMIFLGFSSDPLGKSFQINQSLNAIGSGGLFGKDSSIFGTQAEHNFLPIAESDFIISSIAEKFGFVSIFLIIVLLLYFIYWSFIFALKIENKFASIVIIGFCSVLFMHMIINMSMISGLLPVMGLPAPFISYGGSFFITCSIMVGFINNIISNNI